MYRVSTGIILVWICVRLGLLDIALEVFRGNAATISRTLLANAARVHTLAGLVSYMLVGLMTHLFWPTFVLSADDIPTGLWELARAIVYLLPVFYAIYLVGVIPPATADPVTVSNYPQATIFAYIVGFGLLSVGLAKGLVAQHVVTA